MKFKPLAMGIAALVVILGAVLISAPAASAGSNNGTTNWYHSDYCTASGGRFDATNYDKIISGSVWQEYHLDADRAGGVGSAPKVYIRIGGEGSWRLLSNWNDFYIQQSNEWVFNDFKAVFANGSACYVIQL